MKVVGAEFEAGSTRGERAATESPRSDAAAARETVAAMRDDGRTDLTGDGLTPRGGPRDACPDVRGWRTVDGTEVRARAARVPVGPEPHRWRLVETVLSRLLDGYEATDADPVVDEPRVAALHIRSQLGERAAAGAAGGRRDGRGTRRHGEATNRTAKPDAEDSC